MTSVDLAALTSELKRLAELIPEEPYGSNPLALAPVAKLAAPDRALEVLLGEAACTALVIANVDADVARGDGHLERISAVACSPPERCWLGAHDTMMGFEPVFIRETPGSTIDRPALAMIRHWSNVFSPGLARPRAIVASGPNAVVTFDRILGTSLDRLLPLSPPLALALLAAANRDLDLLHAAGMTHGALRAKRIRITLAGRTVLCYGFDAAPITHERDRATLARTILETAFDDPLLMEILDGGAEGACAVAADRIVEKNPSLADLAPAAMWHETESDELTRMLRALITRDEALALIACAVRDSGL